MKLRPLIISIIIIFIFLPAVYARMTEAEKDEFDDLQSLVDRNSRMTEKQMQRWEELFLKDPEVMERIRQESIKKWKDSVRDQGGILNEPQIDSQAEKQWQHFLETKDAKIRDLNEKNVVILLDKIREACRIAKQQDEKYPSSLNSLLVNNSSIIEPELFKKVDQNYSIRYEKIVESYRVFAFPRSPGITGQKIFLLDENDIFFTQDGSVPTPNSNKLL
jgi:hypothetical protein